MMKKIIPVHFDATVAYYLPHGVDGTQLDSDYYDFGWTHFYGLLNGKMELHMLLVSRLDYMSCN